MTTAIATRRDQTLGVHDRAMVLLNDGWYHIAAARPRKRLGRRPSLWSCELVAGVGSVRADPDVAKADAGCPSSAGL